MSTFILIVAISASGSGGGSFMAMQEFTTYARCEAAKAVAVKTYKSVWQPVSVECVLK